MYIKLFKFRVNCHPTLDDINVRTKKILVKWLFMSIDKTNDCYHCGKEGKGIILIVNHDNGSNESNKSY